MEERKLNENKCIDCGGKFYTFGKTRRKLCDKCAKARKSNSDIYTNVYNKRKKDKPGLNDFMREVEEYNRSHGTCLTYGQYTTLTNKLKSDKME